MKLKNLASFGPAVLFLAGLCILWEVLAHFFQVSERVLPAPSAIANALLIHWSEILPHLMQTVWEVMFGLTIATVLGVGIALFLDRSDFVRKTVYPLLITSQTIPLIALAPLLLLWFGFGIFPKVIMVTLYCFFPIAIATVGGLAQTERDLLQLLLSMDATYWQTLRYVRIPSALPSFFSGLKIAATYSVSGAIVGEYVGAYQGLGIYMQTMAHSYATVLVFAAIAVTVILSLFLFGLVVLLERLFLPWQKAS